MKICYKQSQSCIRKAEMSNIDFFGSVIIDST